MKRRSGGRWSRRAAVLGVAALTACVAPDRRGAEQPGRPALDPVGPGFVAVQVEDLESALAWYADVFSVEVVNALDAPDGRYRIRLLSNGTTTIELLEQPAAVAEPPLHRGLFKVGFHVRDVDATWAWLRDRGADVDDSVVYDEALEARTFLIRDPEGNRLQFFEACDGACPP